MGNVNPPNRDLNSSTPALPAIDQGKKDNNLVALFRIFIQMYRGIVLKPLVHVSEDLRNSTPGKIAKYVLLFAPVVTVVASMTYFIWTQGPSLYESMASHWRRDSSEIALEEMAPRILLEPSIDEEEVPPKSDLPQLEQLLLELKGMPTVDERPKAIPIPKSKPKHHEYEPKTYPIDGGSDVAGPEKGRSFTTPDLLQQIVIEPTFSPPCDQSASAKNLLDFLNLRQTSRMPKCFKQKDSSLY